MDWAVFSYSFGISNTKAGKQKKIFGYFLNWGSIIGTGGGYL
jgi:hypothetical protein